MPGSYAPAANRFFYSRGCPVDEGPLGAARSAAMTIAGHFRGIAEWRAIFDLLYKRRNLWPRPPQSKEPTTKRGERLNGSAPDRKRKWLHAGAAAEPDGRVLGDPPSVGADFDATPGLVRQIEVDQAVLLGEADRDLVLRTVELGLRLQHIKDCVERGWVRRIPGALVVLLAQPGLKALAAQRPGFRWPSMMRSAKAVPSLA